MGSVIDVFMVVPFFLWGVGIPLLLVKEFPMSIFNGLFVKSSDKERATGLKSLSTMVLWIFVTNGLIFFLMSLQFVKGL